MRAQKEKARNALETFVIDMQNNIYTEEYEKAVTEEEKEKILSSCSEVEYYMSYQCLTMILTNLCNRL